jgi:hypothetical protein
VTLHIPTAIFPYSIIDPEAKPGDKIRLEGEVVHVDEELGRIPIQTLGRLTVDADTVSMVKKYRRRRGAEPLRQRPA